MGLSPHPKRVGHGGGCSARPFGLGQFDDAAKAARRAVDQNPRFAQGLRLLAASLAQLGRTTDAKRALSEALAIEPQLTLSNLQRRMARVDEALWVCFSRLQNSWPRCLEVLPKWHWSYVCELLRFVIHFRSQPAGDRDEPYNTILCLVCP